MKLAIIIPAFNEEKSIGNVIKNIPRQIPYVDNVKVMVIDDGSADNTVRVAMDAGCDYIISHKTNLGLARAVTTGLQGALSIDADGVVILDADNQFDPGQIPQLVEPICKGSADLVIGYRQILKDDHTTLSKKIGNILATKITSIVAGVKLKDAQSGFRALSKEAILKVNILSNYTYTQEMIIQCAYKRLKITDVPVEVRKRKEGKSRLISNIFSYAAKAGITIVRTALPYKGLKVFSTLAAAFFGASAIFGLPLIWQGASSLLSGIPMSGLMAAIFFVLGIQTAILALYSESAKSRMLLIEQLLYMQKQNKVLDHKFAYIRNLEAARSQAGT